jgi:AcrR family transcriptional regulator
MEARERSGAGAAALPSTDAPRARAGAAAPPGTEAPRARAGTAVQSRGQDRADEILAAARAVMIQDGYPALTTRKVAERVGIRQSNVQYYFPTKADLVRGLFEASVRRSSRAISERLAQDLASPEARLLGSISHFLETHHSLDEMRFLRELWALSAHDPDVDAVMQGLYRRWVDLTASNLMLINPALGKSRAQRRALLIISLIDGLSLFHGATALDHPAVHGIEREVSELVLAMAQGTGGDR